jgi:hypothetical protein
MGVLRAAVHCVSNAGGQRGDADAAQLEGSVWARRCRCSGIRVGRFLPILSWLERND